MSIPVLLVAAAFFVPTVRSQAPAAAPAPAAATKKDAPVYDEQADARAEVKAAVQNAARENRRVLIQWGANWCGWCKMLAAKMRADKELAHELLYEFDVVKIDVGHFDKNLDLAKELGAEFQAIPFLTVLGADGKAIAQANTEPFETKEPAGHDAAKLLAFLKGLQTTPQAADAVLAAGLEQAKKDGKRVFLHFGAPWCPWCHQLDDWMRSPDAAALLAKDFVDVKIDTDRMTGGEAVLQAQREKASAKEGGIPWIAFLDAEGAQLATSDATGGNIGFPSKDAEIAWFGEMLGKARRNLGDADIAALKASLVSWRDAKRAHRNQ